MKKTILILSALAAVFLLASFGGDTVKSPTATAEKAETALSAGSTIPADVLAKLDKELPAYKSVSGISGNLNSIGSDTLNNMMLNWAEGFRTLYPNVNIQIQGAGSSTAPAALLEGTAQLGPMSRAMSSKEIDDFEKKYGYKPTEVIVAIDALGVFVHRENPIKGLSLQQVDAIFSNTFRLGGKPILKWGQAGLTGDWANRPISLYGRNSVSGTYGFFKQVALGGGDYDGARYQEQPGSSTVIQSVTSDRFGIGYSGIGYLTSGTRAIPLSKNPGGKFIEPTALNAISGEYPLARFLYIYINKNPREPLNALTYEFLRYINSLDGQAIVVKDGFYPLPGSVAKKTTASLK